MLTQSLLFHYSPPADIASEPFLSLLLPGDDLRVVTLKEISAFRDPLVTYSFEMLVDWLRQSELPLPSEVIDISLAKKLVVGRPKSAYGRRKPWEPWELVSPYLEDQDKTSRLQHYFSTQLTSPHVNAGENPGLSARILRSLSRLWEDLQTELKNRGEEKRFADVEVPAYNAMLRSQYLGICVDEMERDSLLIQVQKAHVAAHHKLAIRHGINVERAFTDPEYLQIALGIPHEGVSSSISVDEIITLRKNHDERCFLLHTVRSARRNRTILTRTFSQMGTKCYPLFDTMGTVSGRILAVDPQLQHLKKSYRSVLIPRSGRTFLYVDYSQFEPTILANMSRDETLSAWCTDGDLYVKLADRVFGARDRRKEAKRLFLAYSYGMTQQGLAELASLVIGDNKRALQSINDRLWGALMGVERWKGGLQQELKANGRIGTGCGNFRYRTSSGELGLKEKRWGVSHVVQGTGALILKRLITRVSSLLPAANILLPMHDALLLEIPGGSAENFAECIIQHCREAFLEVCPGLAPRIRIEPFAQG